MDLQIRHHPCGRRERLALERDRRREYFVGVKGEVGVSQANPAVRPGEDAQTAFGRAVGLEPEVIVEVDVVAGDLVVLGLDGAAVEVGDPVPGLELDDLSERRPASKQHQQRRQRDSHGHARLPDSIVG